MSLKTRRKVTLINKGKCSMLIEFILKYSAKIGINSEIKGENTYFMRKVVREIYR